MKGIAILAILATVGFTLIQWKKTKNHKRAAIAIATFAAIVSLAVAGQITRSVMPIYAAHLMLVISAWGSLVWYLVRGRYYWYIAFSPILTIILFVVMETLTGSGSPDAIVQ